MAHLCAFEWFQVLQISGILSARCWKYLCLTCGSDETMFMKFVFKSGYRVNRNVLLLPCWFLQTNSSPFSSFVLACWHFNFYNFHFLSLSGFLSLSLIGCLLFQSLWTWSQLNIFSRKYHLFIICLQKSLTSMYSVTCCVPCITNDQET